jgi:polysaccharide export outer membrane protein
MVPPNVPRELQKVAFPEHLIAPPDVLLISGVRLMPRSPYALEPLDSVYIRVTNTPPEDPIDGVYPIEPDGRLQLGASYGTLIAAGKTVEQIRQEIETLMKPKIRAFQVTVHLVQTRAQQLIAGEHLVQPDGKVDLGIYGSVYVAGMTTEVARQLIETALAKYFDRPQVTVKMAAFNSNVYYIVTDGGGLGEQVYRLPATGGETVLDAMSYINGLPAVASRKRIWIARPGPNHDSQILPVDWVGLTRGAATATNYQMMPGDRIYVQAQPIITADVTIARFLSPVERIFGITLLGNAVVEAVKPGQSGF